MLKCTKFNFGWGSALDPLAGLRGPTSKGRGKGREKGRGRKGKGRKGEGGDGKGRGRGKRKGEGKGGTPPFQAPPQPIFLDTILSNDH